MDLLPAAELEGGAPPPPPVFLILCLTCARHNAACWPRTKRKQPTTHGGPRVLGGVGVGVWKEESGARHSPNFWKWGCAQPSSFKESFPFPGLSQRDLSNALTGFRHLTLIELASNFSHGEGKPSARILKKGTEQI